jgi:hypothetical protein
MPSVGVAAAPTRAAAACTQLFFNASLMRLCQALKRTAASLRFS